MVSTNLLLSLLLYLLQFLPENKGNVYIQFVIRRLLSAFFLAKWLVAALWGVRRVWTRLGVKIVPVKMLIGGSQRLQVCEYFPSLSLKQNPAKK